MMRAKILKYIPGIFVLASLLIISCKKDNSQIPEVLVDIQVNINNPGYMNLQAVGGWMYFDGGSRGIVVYRRSTDEFMAYDRHCPYQASGCGIIAVDSTNIIATDNSCCGARFLLTDGSVQSSPGPSNNLKRYQTYWDGSSILRIYN